MAWDMGVAVVFHHAGVSDVGASDSVEFIEGVVVESARDFDGAVASEVEEDDAIAVFDGAGGFAISDDDEGWEVLIADAVFFFTERFDGFGGAGEVARLPEDMGFPTAFDDAPIGFVAVHRRDHAAAARGDAIVAVGVGVDSGE